MPTDYDVFVSYKSDDVMLVRPVVDGLIAAGARVWFAEYSVLLAAREEHRGPTDAAIRRSARGLIFTNNRYVESRHCQAELEQLLQFVGARNLLEVPLPAEEAPHRSYPSLAESVRLDFVDCDTIVQQVCDRLGLDFVARPQPRRRSYRDAAGRHAGWKGRPTVYEGTLLNRPWAVALNGWTVEKDPIRNASYADMLPEFKYATRNPVLHASIFAGVDAAPETKHLSDMTHGPEKTDDRRLYNYLLEHVPSHLGAVGVEPIGVHLLFSSPGMGQMGLTYLSEMNGGSFWTRKVSVVLANHAASATGEFVFTFSLHGGLAHWRDYCLMTCVMDKLAVSLAWE